MKTTYYLRSLLMAVLSLLMLTSVSAQTEITTLMGYSRQYPATGYETSPVKFSLTEVATELGTDAATLGATLNEWLSAEKGTATTNYVFLVMDDALDSNYTTNLNGGFWMNIEGKNVGYADACWYVDVSCSVEEDYIAFNVGQKPGAMADGDLAGASFMLVYGEKAINFFVSITIAGADIPETTSLKESDLEIVGEKEITIEQYPRTGYDADNDTLVLDDLAEKLGIADLALLQGNLGSQLYTTAFDTETVGKLDTLTNVSTAGAPGFWFTDIRVNGEATGECSANIYGAGDFFFMEGFALNAETAELTWRTGQYPGNLKGGEKYFTYLYIVYGDQAYRIKVNFNCKEVPQGEGLNGYTKVGEETVVVEQEPTDDYSTKAISPDLEAIAAALGCEVADIRMKALDINNSFAGSTANNGGFWFDAEGFVCAWGGSAVMFVEPTNAPDAETNIPNLTTFNVGQYPNVLSAGAEQNAYIHFFNGEEGDKYYTYIVKLKVKEAQQVDTEGFENVKTIAFNIQAVPSPDAYDIEETWSIDLAVLESILGTTDVKLYGQATDAKAEETGSPFSDKYSCDPKPGFWLDADGRVSTWSSTCPVGICYASDGTFQFFQYPGTNAVGDIFKTDLYLVNSETSKMITFRISVAFVESIVKAEVAGEESISIPVSEAGINTIVSLAAAADSLGVTVGDLFADAEGNEHQYLCGITESGSYSEGKTCFDGLGFDENGFFNLTESAKVLFTLEQTDEGVVMNAYTMGAIADDFILPTKFCFQIDNRQYIFNVTFMSEAKYADLNSGIATINSDSRKNGQLYDLSGRKVEKAARGLYIMNGRKYIVK